jgi:hypothetical protein
MLHAPPYATMHHHAPPCTTMRHHVAFAISGACWIQSSAPTFFEEIATTRLKDRYKKG